MRQFQEIEKFVSIAKEKQSKNKPIKTHARHFIIVPDMIRMKLMIHNGKTFVHVDVIEEMLGHRFGEFAPTRPKIKHGSAGLGATKGSKSKAKK